MGEILRNVDKSIHSLKMQEKKIRRMMESTIEQKQRESKLIHDRLLVKIDEAAYYLLGLMQKIDNGPSPEQFIKDL